MIRRDEGKVAVALLLWLTTVAFVITSELLPAHSAPMLWVGAMHVSDKALHFAAYTLLAFIPCFGFAQPTGISLAAVTIVLGVALEFTQELVPGRSFEFADMLANATGVVAGGTVGILARRIGTARGRELVKSKTG
jgi:hypothetical protein